jgi:flagellar basal body-associated protein FliL
MTKSEAFRNILQSQELNDEIESMRKELVELIINSDDDEVATREGAYVRIKVINEIMSRFESIAKDDEIKDKAWKIL